MLYPKGKKNLFPLNAHISPVCIRLSADKRRTRPKYEHFPSNGKYTFSLLARFKKRLIFTTLLPRFEGSFQICRKCAVFPQKYGCNCGECGSFTENQKMFPFVCRKTNLIKSDVSRTEMGKKAELAVFIVFGGGKAYIGIPNRRKQSTLQTIAVAQHKKNTCHFIRGRYLLLILCVKDS